MICFEICKPRDLRAIPTREHLSQPARSYFPGASWSILESLENLESLVQHPQQWWQTTNGTLTAVLRESAVRPSVLSELVLNQVLELDSELPRQFCNPLSFSQAMSY